MMTFEPQTPDLGGAAYTGAQIRAALVPLLLECFSPGGSQATLSETQANSPASELLQGLGRLVRSTSTPRLTIDVAAL